MKVGIIGYSIFDDFIRSEFPNCRFYNIIPNINFAPSTLKEYYIFDITKPSQTPDKLFISFDVIIFTEVLEHLLNDDDLIIFNVYNLLKANGFLIFSVPNISAFGKLIKLMVGENPYMSKADIINGVFGGYGHIREYSFHEVTSLLQRKFNVLVIKGFNDYPNASDQIAKILPKIYAETIFTVAMKK